MGFRPVRLTRGFLGALAGAFGVHLRRADLATPNDLARFGAHGGITASLASPGNATRISCADLPKKIAGDWGYRRMTAYNRAGHAPAGT